MGDLRQAPLHLDPCDDQLAIARTQLHQRDAVPIVLLGLNGGFERRLAIRRKIVRNLDRRRLPPDAPHFVANAVDHRLPEIRLHRADVARLKAIEPAQHVQRRVLDDVVGVECAAGGGRQAAVSPAFQRRQAALQQRLRRGVVARLRANDQLNRRLVAEQPFFVDVVRGHRELEQPS